MFVVLFVFLLYGQWSQRSKELMSLLAGWRVAMLAAVELLPPALSPPPPCVAAMSVLLYTTPDAP